MLTNIHIDDDILVLVYLHLLSNVGLCGCYLCYLLPFDCVFNLLFVLIDTLGLSYQLAEVLLTRICTSKQTFAPFSLYLHEMLLGTNVSHLEIFANCFVIPLPRMIHDNSPIECDFNMLLNRNVNKQKTQESNFTSILNHILHCKGILKSRVNDASSVSLFVKISSHKFIHLTRYRFLLAYQPG
uniref:Uncharacterized protein n=1 Tax=Glossina brevipalpis TaxID=37001 RepID=A0A1A9X2Y8_9MUSC